MKRFIGVYEHPKLKETWLTVFVGFFFGIGITVSFGYILILSRQALPIEIATIYANNFWCVILLLVLNSCFIGLILYGNWRENNGKQNILLSAGLIKFMHKHKALALTFVYTINYIVFSPFYMYKFLYLNLPRRFTEPQVRFHIKHKDKLLALHYPNGFWKMLFVGILFYHGPKVLIAFIFFSN
jgi:hypothetical protein